MDTLGDAPQVGMDILSDVPRVGLQSNGDVPTPSPQGVGHLKFEARITVTYLNHTLHYTHYSGHCGTHMITVIWSQKCANLSLLAAYSGNDNFFLFGSNIITKG